jgi:MOSC domain-containing protein
MSTLRVTALWNYPVKSCRGIGLDSAQVSARGLRWDRHWMVVDQSGRFLTQRDLPAMATIAPNVTSEVLRLRAPGRPDLELPLDAVGGAALVMIWRDTLRAHAVSEAADRWLSDHLGVACRLVRFADDVCRSVDPAYGVPGDETAFSDGFPLLLVGQGSLDELNRRLSRPLPMRRFRPNLVVEGAGAHAEDGWRLIRAGPVSLRVVKPCSRCAITTVDPDRGVRDGAEPLETLATYRRRDGKVYFGQNVIPDGAGEIRVGDIVEVIDDGR